MKYNEIESRIIEVITQLKGSRISKLEFYDRVGYSMEKCDYALNKLSNKGRIRYSIILDNLTDPMSQMQFEAKVLIRTEYRIIGRFRKDDKSHVVDYDRKWNEKDAEKRLAELKAQSEREMSSKRRDVISSGMIGISTEYYSDYDLLDLRIQSREVTPWSDMH